MLLLFPDAPALLAATNPAASSATSTAPEAPPPTTPREFFNAGTEKLRLGKLRESEALFESVLASQVERLQPPALYNLGHVRFGQGAEELKKGPQGQPTSATGRAVARQTDEAIRVADEALAGDDLQKLVAAYQRGRGQRKELKAATALVRRALQIHAAALTKWQRASGDFHSTIELKRTDADAQHNAEVVDRCIAKLIDTLKELQDLANALGQKKNDLGQKMKQLKGRIPAEDAPPGAAGDEEEEEEDQPKGPQPGQVEGPTREGEEMRLSPEQASWLLEGFRLDAERRLPMGMGDQAEPKNRNRPTW